MTPELATQQARIRTTLGLLGFCALLGVSSAEAASLTNIELSGGLISGTLNSVPFTDQPWVLEGQGDLSTAVYDPSLGVPAYFVSMSSVTITIGAGGTPTALSGNWQFTSGQVGLQGTTGFCDLIGSGCFGAGIAGAPELFFNPATVAVPLTETGTSLFNDDAYSSGLLVITSSTNGPGNCP